MLIVLFNYTTTVYSTVYIALMYISYMMAESNLTALTGLLSLRRGRVKGCAPFTCASHTCALPCAYIYLISGRAQTWGDCAHLSRAHHIHAHWLAHICLSIPHMRCSANTTVRRLTPPPPLYSGTCAVPDVWQRTCVNPPLPLQLSSPTPHILA